MLVSIVIPVRNAAATLPATLVSALRAGTRVPGEWELIVVDNGSTDTSRELARRFHDEHSMADIHLLDQPTPGAPAARNAGLRAARGEWVQFLDSDDLLAPDKIAHQLALARPNTEWIVGGYQNRYPDGTAEDVPAAADLWRGLAHGFRTGCTHSNLTRRATLLRIGGWNEKLVSNQDPDLYFRLLRAEVPCLVDPTVKSYYLHHYNPDRVTHTGGAVRYRIRAEFLVELNDYLARHRPDYYAAQRSYYRGALLRGLRLLATYDLDAAAGLYREHFGGAERLELVPAYARLYPWLGFRRLEELRVRVMYNLRRCIPR